MCHNYPFFFLVYQPQAVLESSKRMKTRKNWLFIFFTFWNIWLFEILATNYAPHPFSLTTWGGRTIPLAHSHRASWRTSSHRASRTSRSPSSPAPGARLPASARTGDPSSPPDSAPDSSAADWSGWSVSCGTWASGCPRCWRRQWTQWSCNN